MERGSIGVASTGTLDVNVKTPKTIAAVGGVLIAVSGLVNAALGARVNALVYDVYPGGRMGHVGIIAGIAAIVIGMVIVFLVVPLYKRRKRALLALGGFLTIVLGHAGAVAGAIYVGTAGVILCYIAGVWLLVIAARGVNTEDSRSHSGSVTT
ncbi:MAG TPA: hypothetical protein VLC48_01775 [Gemmatimonadota bacterium]|nr:hypothetical protein [Gemmatimonadota bacterium]